MTGYIGEIARYAHDSATNVASITVPISVAAPVGTRIIMAVTNNANSAITGYTATDTKGNTWTQRAFQLHATVNNAQLGILECIVTTALTTSDTITVGNTSSLRSPAIWIALAQGFSDLSAGFDVQASATGTSTAAASGSSSTTTQPDDLVFGAVAGTGNPTFTVGSGYTAPASGVMFATTTPRFLAVEWKYVTSAGTQASNGTLGSSQGWCAAVAAFKQDAPAATPFCYLRTSSTDLPMDMTVA